MVIHNKDKVPNTLPPVFESEDSESLYVRLAKDHAKTSYASVTKKYLGESTPLYVDHNL